jgi:hypothetical protein
MFMSYDELENWLKNHGYWNWCFISWAHAPGQLTDFVQHLQKDLLAEFRTNFSWGEVFLDMDGIRTGDAWEARIAENLCRSVMMVPVYTPPYFSSKRSYCGREWQGMEDLHAARTPASTRHLVHPVILRAPDQVPRVAAGLQYNSDLSRAALRKRAVWETEDCWKSIHKIREHAVEMAENLVTQRARADCAGYRLPRSSPFIAPRPAPVLPTRSR